MQLMERMERKEFSTDQKDEATAAQDRIRPLSDIENEWKKLIYDRLLKLLDLSLLETIESDRAREEIQQIATRLMVEESAPLSLRQRKVIIQRIEDEIMGLGPLEPLLADKSVSDILVNGAKNVWIERKGKLAKTNIVFADDRHLLNTIDRIVSAVGRRIDESSPMVDARLADGSRVNAIIPPLAIDGPALSIRRFSVELLSIDELIKFATITPEVAKVMEAVVKARLNILISGGTGAGKTTTLNILSSFIPHDERIVTIEDSAELQLQQPHVVRLETRPANIEGRGEVSARDLVRNSLRMRPERIIVGEVRAGEAFDMLQAMNTGHDGSLTTVHANTPRDALGRIENMVSMSGVSFPINVLRTQIASAINLVMQVSRLEDGTRKVTSLQEVNGMEGDVVTMSELFRFERERIDEDGKVIGKLKATGMVPAFHKLLAPRGIVLPIETFEPDWDSR